MDVFTAAKQCLDACDVSSKLALTASHARAWREQQLTLVDDVPLQAISQAGHPARPELVPPRQLARRSLHTDEGRAALIHAIAHIEFNAINLAWDAVYRFRDMPRDYYTDWIQVAAEEATHFALLREHLQSLGYDYGDFKAHNGLWEMAEKTAADPMVRMALVPRVLEARGLDVTPAMIQRLQDAGDDRAVEILHVILQDEVGHVAIGSRWYHYLCEKRGIDPVSTFRKLIHEYMKGDLKGPFHMEARQQAGFTQAEIEYLESL
jgi:uncharacterized ferritin-like protein (DUF455 family)